MEDRMDKVIANFTMLMRQVKEDWIEWTRNESNYFIVNLKETQKVRNRFSD